MVGPEQDSRALIFFLLEISLLCYPFKKKNKTIINNNAQNAAEFRALWQSLLSDDGVHTLLFLGRQCHLVAAGGGWIRTGLCSQRPCTTKSFYSLQEMVMDFVWEPRTPQRRGSCEPRKWVSECRLNLYTMFNTTVYFFCVGEESNRNKVLIAVSRRMHAEAGRGRMSAAFPERMLRHGPEGRSNVWKACLWHSSS